VATLAGADPATALRLAGSMLALQASIGAVNDLVDEPLDAAVKPMKPLPAGLISRRAAQLVAVGTLLAGLVLSAPSGAATVGVAAVGVGLGYLYDLRLSRTAASWVPLALALPLVPIHAWLGSTGTVPAGLWALVPAAALAGAGLAISNGLVDVERDARAGREGTSVTLGRGRAWIAATVLLATAGVFAIVVAPDVESGAGGAERTLLRIVRLGGTALGVVLIAVGAGLLRAGRASVRERGWELEALGVACLGVGWLAGTAANAAA
jgi:4-hydroxybenzoate polyprenyltransferase